MEVEALPTSCISSAAARWGWALFAALCVSSSALLLAGQAHGSMMLPMTVEELTEDSELVAVGQVVKKESRISQGGGRIFTVVTIEVEEAWKGAPPKQVELHVPGGTVDGISQVVMGVPQFTEGEEAVVFLRALLSTAEGRLEAATPDSSEGAEVAATPVQARLVGMAQGKLEVRLDPRGEKLAAPNLSGLELVDPKTSQLAPLPLPEPVPLSTLKARVQAADK